MQADLNTSIATIVKGNGSEVRVSLCAFRGRHLIDVRTFLAIDASKELRATKKGLSLPIERLRNLRKALATAERQAVAMGWLDAEGRA